MNSPMKIENVVKLRGNDQPSPIKLRFADGKQVPHTFITSNEQYVLKEDLRSFQQSINKQISDHTESIKEEISKLKYPPANLEEYTTLDGVLKEFMASCAANNANVWKHCLEDRDTLEKQETKVASLEIGLKNAHAKIRALESSRDTITNEIADISTNKVEIGVVRGLQDDIKVLHSKLSSTALSNSQNLSTKVDTQNGIISEIQDALKVMKGQVRNLQQEVFLKTKDNHLGGSQRNDGRNNTNQVQSYSDKTVTAHNLMLVDSNGSKIDENRLSRDPGFKCNKFFTPTLEDIINFCSQVQCEHADLVAKIVINVGTNNFDTQDSVHITSTFKEVINLLQAKFKEAEIYVCTIIPRAGEEMKEEISLVNDYLRGARKMLKVAIIDLSPITADMLYDNKHLGGKGKHYLISSIQMALTGILPIFNTNNNNNNSGRNSRGARGGGRYRRRGGR